MNYDNSLECYRSTFVGGKERHFGSFASCAERWLELSTDDRATARIETQKEVVVPTRKKSPHADDIDWLTEQLEPDEKRPLMSAP